MLMLMLMINVISPLLQVDTELCRLFKQYIKDFRPELCSPESNNDFLFLVSVINIPL